MEELGSESLIPGLPDDIALSCLARVPRRYHRVLKCVSRRWRDLVCGEDLYSYRKRCKLEETWIYALCIDKSGNFCCCVLDPSSPRRCWKPIEALPRDCLERRGIRFEVLGRNIYVMGGCDWYENAFDEVYVYDASANTWSKGVPLLTGRSYFSCEVVDEKIYIMGGLQSRNGFRYSCDSYDPQTTTWTSLPSCPLIENRDSFVMDGKIYINSTAPFITDLVYALAYEPSSDSWKSLPDDMSSGWWGPAVVVNGTIYVLDERSGTRLMMWKEDVREWVPVGRLSPLRTRPPCQLVAVGKTMFVVGRGLSTVVFDVDNASNVEGTMVCSSVPGLDSIDYVISCKCLTI